MNEIKSKILKYFLRILSIILELVVASLFILGFINKLSFEQWVSIDIICAFVLTIVGFMGEKSISNDYSTENQILYPNIGGAILLIFSLITYTQYSIWVLIDFIVIGICGWTIFRLFKPMEG